MKVVIIEDEPLTAKDLAGNIMKAGQGIEIVAVLASVKEAVAYFKEHDEPDLIFSDIQLGDGLSFSIFDTAGLSVPVIFCTAYDEYALDAFKAAGIDYILKPFDTATIKKALDKYHKLRERFASPHPKGLYEGLAAQVQAPRANCVLVNFKDKILPVKFGDIALFYIRNDITHLQTFGKERYLINKTLEELEQLAPQLFYRVSRQHIINRDAIKDVSQYFGRKLLLNLNIPFEGKITVSKARASHFLAWLSA